MKCVIVLGTTRSCTSAVAGVLHTLGCRMVDPYHAIGSHQAFNAKGHFEDLRWWTLNREVREQLDLHVDQVVAYEKLIASCRREPIWGVKDPAFISMGDMVFPLITDDVYYVAVHRRFDATVSSVQRHHNGGRGASLAQATVEVTKQRYWLSEMLYWVSPIHHLQAEMLMVDPEREISELLRFLDWLPDGGMQEAVDFIDPAMYHFPGLA